MITHDIAEAISLADRVIVLSKRPSCLKSIYNINLTDIGTQRRRNSQFNYYYDLLWKDLDKSV